MDLAHLLLRSFAEVVKEIHAQAGASLERMIVLLAVETEMELAEAAGAGAGRAINMRKLREAGERAPAHVIHLRDSILQ